MRRRGWPRCPRPTGRFSSRSASERSARSAQIPPLQVPLEHRDVERLSGGTRDEFGRGEAGAEAVDVLLQPALQDTELALLNLRRDLRVRLAGRLEQLRGGHGAEA